MSMAVDYVFVNIPFTFKGFQITKGPDRRIDQMREATYTLHFGYSCDESQPSYQ